MQCLDNLMRMADDGCRKKIFKGKLMENRSVGTSRMVQLEEVEKDLIQNKITNYKLKASDRKVWWHIVGETKIFHGLQCRGDDDDHEQSEISQISD